MKTFYRCFIESALTSGFLSWHGGLGVTHRNTLSRVVRHSSKVIGEDMKSLETLYTERAARKGWQISQDPKHPLNSRYSLLPSGRRFQQPLCNLNRTIKSFVPSSIRLLNT